MENILAPKTDSETHRPNDPCRACPDGLVPVEQRENGRFFITMGHAGFNVRANNGPGFKTAGAAMAAARRCGHGRQIPAAPAMLTREQHCTHPDQRWCDCDWCRIVRGHGKLVA
jgi:hypothetical protein